jgi:hypothetical protein
MRRCLPPGHGSDGDGPVLVGDEEHAQCAFSDLVARKEGAERCGEQQIAQIDDERGQDQRADRQAGRRGCPEVERHELGGAGKDQATHQHDLDEAKTRTTGENTPDQPIGGDRNGDRQAGPGASEKLIYRAGRGEGRFGGHDHSIARWARISIRAECLCHDIW